MVDTLAGYLDNIAAAATTTRGGIELVHLSAIMAILVNTNTAQAKELNQMREQINDLCNNNSNP